ncbi:MAG TPA: transposase [Pyrinomonadaceae bacterium]|jgi:REP element-mobilizing transposase RayT|nr:transposase [Pyrinomonadaceae bacterium]
MFRDSDDNVFPLAYLLTFRCYGTWVHGDRRGSMDRQGHNVYGTPRIAPNEKLERADAGRLKYPPVTLDTRRRATVEKAIREVCEHRGFRLDAVNVRTNHVHAVVAAACGPEGVMTSFKSYATRMLREDGLLSAGAKPWARHGSTRYLWKPHHVVDAIDYVLYGQGDEPPNFDN